MSACRQYLDDIRALHTRAGALPDGPSFARFILDHGRAYPIGPKTFEGKRGVAKACYMNATLLARRDRTMTYVEGYAAGMFPIPHAWCIDATGAVVEPTLTNDDRRFPFDDYFGVPFKTDFLLAQTRRNACYGLLGYPECKSAKPLFTGEISPAEAIRTLEAA